MRFVLVVNDFTNTSMAISKKEILASPMRLQKILYDILPYSSRIIYKSGKSIPMPDALSRDPVKDHIPNIDSDGITYVFKCIL